jgi:hypothetical protein
MAGEGGQEVVLPKENQATNEYKDHMLNQHPL